MLFFKGKRQKKINGYILLRDKTFFFCDNNTFFFVEEPKSQLNKLKDKKFI